MGVAGVPARSIGSLHRMTPSVSIVLTRTSPSIWPSARQPRLFGFNRNPPIKVTKPLLASCLSFIGRMAFHPAVEGEEDDAVDAAGPQHAVESRHGQRRGLRADPEKLGAKAQFLGPLLRAPRDFAVKQHQLGAAVDAHVHQREHAAETLVPGTAERRQGGPEQRIGAVARLVGCALDADAGNADALRAKRDALQGLLTASGGHNLSETMWLKSEIAAVDAALG